MNINEVRNYFPFIKTGKIFFDHAAVSPISIIVKERIEDYLYNFSGNEIEDIPRLIQTANETKVKIAKLINATPDRIAFVDNTSNGLNIIAQGLQWQKGDIILLNDIEFPSNVYPFLNLKQYGVEIEFVKSHSGIVSAEDIINSVKPKTKLISVSFVQFLSGYKIDLELLSDYCKSKNIIFCVDGIQGLGAMQFDISKYKIDFLASGTQKWLMGFMGLAFIYISKELQNKINPKYIGWSSIKNSWDLLNYKLDLKDDASVFENGTLNYVGIISLNASLDLLFQFGIKEVEKIILENTEYFFNQLRKINIKPLLENLSNENLSGIITFQPKDSQKLFDNLKNEKIICSIREGMIRFSPHFYNTKEEIDKVVNFISKYN